MTHFAQSQSNLLILQRISASNGICDSWASHPYASSVLNCILYNYFMFWKRRQLALRKKNDGWVFEHALILMSYILFTASQKAGPKFPKCESAFLSLTMPVSFSRYAKFD